MPLESRFRKALEAQWEFQVVDMERRLVAFKDRSHGNITSWSWEFDDGTTRAINIPSTSTRKPGNTTSYSPSRVRRAARGASK